MILLCLRCILAVYSVLKKVRLSFDVVDIVCARQVPHLTSGIVPDSGMFRSVVTKNCVWKSPVKLKAGRGVVIWSMIFGKVMKRSMMKGRESVAVLDCEVFTLQRAGTYVEVRN